MVTLSLSPAPPCNAVRTIPSFVAVVAMASRILSAYDASPMESWDGVTDLIFASERQCLPEDYQGRLEVARQAIGEPTRAFDLHNPACPRVEGGNCACGLVSIFTNDRWVAHVDMFRAIQEIYPLH